jgi:hypothetical protein
MSSRLLNIFTNLRRSQFPASATYQRYQLYQLYQLFNSINPINLSTQKLYLNPTCICQRDGKSGLAVKVFVNDGSNW